MNFLFFIFLDAGGFRWVKFDENDDKRADADRV